MKLDHRFDASHEALSKRETEVLSWVIQGKRDSEIGVILEISSRTVEKHVGQILHKLRVENRTTAAGIAFAGAMSYLLLVRKPIDDQPVSTETLRAPA